MQHTDGGNSSSVSPERRWVQRSDEEIEVLHLTISENHQVIEEQKDALAALRNSLEDSKREIPPVDRYLTGLLDKVDSCRNDEEGLVCEIRSLQDKLEGLEEAAEWYRTQQVACERDMPRGVGGKAALDAARRGREEVEAELRDMREKGARLKGELDGAREEVTHTATILKARLRSQEDEMEVLRKQVAKLQSERFRLLAEKVSLSDQAQHYTGRSSCVLHDGDALGHIKRRIAERNDEILALFSISTERRNTIQTLQRGGSPTELAQAVIQARKREASSAQRLLDTLDTIVA